MTRSYWQSRRRQRIEDGITQAVMDMWRWLGRRDTLVAAIPNRGAIGQPGLTKGLSDLLVLGPDVPGKVAFMELKRDAKAPESDEQIDFRALCERLGVTCVVARGRDEPIRFLELWGVVRRSVNDVEREGARNPSRGTARVAAG